MKTSVIQRMRSAERWCRLHGPAYEWLGVLLVDAAQELESQSGALWCQWMTGRESHVRVFVTGNMGRHELASTIEVLRLSLSQMEEDEAVKLPDPPVQEKSDVE